MTSRPMNVYRPRLRPILTGLMLLTACPSPGQDTATTSGSDGESTSAPTSNTESTAGTEATVGTASTIGTESAAGTESTSTTADPLRCNHPADCPIDVPECRSADCVAGQCVYQDAPMGTPLDDPAPGDCKAAVCDGAGQIAVLDDPADLDDGVACTVDACEGGVPSHAAETKPCYDGPPGTQDVGVCIAGTQTCDIDLGDFGPCEGAVLPADEDCDAMHVDEDCDGVAEESGAACVCGDKFVSNEETCDDGNAVDSDACTNGCVVQAVEGRPAVGDVLVCTRLSGGRVKCWGAGWVLGLGDLANRGDQPGEMGANLPAVDLGVGVNATSAIAGEAHACALLEGGGVKCWGGNNGGQLGSGSTQTRGDQPGEMGDALPPVDLGPGAVAVGLGAGRYHTCAALADGTVKCWGEGKEGQLGLGDTQSRGDQPGEMGANLPVVALGQGLTAVGVVCGPYHTCALLEGGLLKCWGANASGNLGLGDTQKRGDQPGEMGDMLPLVQLGAGVKVVRLALGDSHGCALLDDGRVKCWGDNFVGQLGLGDTQSRGDQPGEMGDALPAVDLGAGQKAVDVAAGQQFSCALLESGAVKCWGVNYTGSLGLGDAVVRGDQPGEMGDALPAVDLGAGRTAVEIDANVYSSATACARLDDASLKCWGANHSGKLGLGDINHRGDQPGEMGDALPTVKLFSDVW